jgi:hypothetical protein
MAYNPPGDEAAEAGEIVTMTLLIIVKADSS